MSHRNLMRDAFHAMMHHCEQQRDGRYDHRQPMAQTGQMSDELAQSVLSLGYGIIILSQVILNNGFKLG